MNILIRSYRVSGKKMLTILARFSQHVRRLFSKTCYIHRLKHGKRGECKREAFEMISDVDKAFCMETNISSKLFDLTRRLFARTLGWDHRKAHPAPNNGTINRWVNKFRGGRLFRRKTGSDRPRSVRPEEALRQVEQSVLDSPERSVRHRAQSLGQKRA